MWKRIWDYLLIKNFIQESDEQLDIDLYSHDIPDEIFHQVSSY
jgi:hypothetical protein